MFSGYMFSVCLLLFMLENTSSMFEVNMLVAIVVMFNILKLIMELLPNYSTIQKPYYRQLWLVYLHEQVMSTLK